MDKCTKKVIPRNILWSLSFFISINCFAEDFFFRVDRRDPVEIFSDGFRPAGSLRDVLRHIEGDACYQPGAPSSEQSAFVSATTEEAVALNIGANWRSGTIFYIYRIRPSSRFYSAFASLDYAYRRSLRPIFASTRDAMAADYEWLALNGIDHTEIHSAQQFTSNGDGTAISGDTTNNPHYVSEGDFQPNRSPFEEYTLDVSDSERSCSECFSSGSESPIRHMTGIEAESKKRWCKLAEALSLQGVINTWRTEL